MKHIKKINEIIGGIENAQLNYHQVKEISFKAWVAGDCESMRNGDEQDRQEFEDWWKETGKFDMINVVREN